MGLLKMKNKINQKDIENALDFREWAKHKYPKVYAMFMSKSKTGKGFPRYK